MTWSFTLKPTFPVQKSHDEEVRICSIAKSLCVEVEEMIFCPISKEDEEERIVRALILQPSDEMSEEDVKAESYHWMESSKKGRVNGVRVLETMIAPVDMRINKKNVRAGSWMMTLKILDDEIWKDFERGEFRIAGESIEEI